MKRAVLSFVAAFVLAGASVFAHGNAEHVRGTVVTISATTITVQVTPKLTRTVTVNPKTMVMKGDAHLTLKDVKVGDRVVVDVDKKTSVATELKLATAPAPLSKAPTVVKSKG
jgi:ribosomal protein S1